MADRIVAAIRVLRPVQEVVNGQGPITAIVGRYATAALYNRPARVLGRLHDELMRAMAKRLLPEAQQAGMQSARPLLDRLGGGRLTAKGSVLRGRVLAVFKRYHKANLAAFEAQLETEIGTVSGEIRAAFARAYRDGVARKQLISDLVAADQAELKRLAVVRREIAGAAEKLARVEATGNARAISQAEKALKAAKGKVGKAKTFYARLETRVQGHARDAVRREAQRAQFASFQQATGVAEYTWVAVNGPEACPDCIRLHGTTKPADEWRGQMPGDGQTVCGAACQCQLIPVSYYRGNKTVEKPIDLPK